MARIEATTRAIDAELARRPPARQQGTAAEEARRGFVAAQAAEICRIHSREISLHPLLGQADSTAGAAGARARESFDSACLLGKGFSAHLAPPERRLREALYHRYLSQGLRELGTTETRLKGLAGTVAEPERQFRLGASLVSVAGAAIACLAFLALGRRFVSLRTAIAAAEPTAKDDEPDLETAAETIAPRQLDATGAFFFCEVFDRTPIPMVLLDGLGRIVRFNHALAERTGLEPSEIQGEYYWQVLLDPADAPQAARRFPPTEATIPVDEMWIGPAGTRRPVRWLPVLFRDDARRASSVLLAELPCGSGSLGSEILSLAEDFYNELTLIGGYGELVLGELPPDHPVCAEVQHICRANERATGALSRLLELARRSAQ